MRMVIIFKGKTHLAIAFIVCFYFLKMDLINMVGVGIGSLIPDIDTPHSILGRFNIFSYIMKHRGITHTIIGLVLFTLIFHFMFGNFTVGFALGYALHLILDSVTPMGIMWLYPFDRGYYSLLGTRKSLHR